MRNRVKTWKYLCSCALCAAGLSTLSEGATTTPKGPPPPPPPPGGIGQASDDLAAQALDLLNNGKLDDAMTAYQSLISKYPNSGDVPEALFRMGYIQYVQGNYDQAVATLKRIVSPPATDEIKAAGDALIPQILAAQAAKMGPNDPGRKSAFQNAIQQFDAFIQKHPKDPQVETARYGMAMAAYQSGDFAGATKSLEDEIKQFPNSESILDSEDLLAVALTAEASGILRDHGDQQDALTKFNEALRYLAYIIQLHKDVALANDAQFQAGEVLFNRGNAEEGATRDKDLGSAISVYREVLPKDMMVAAQQARVAELQVRRRQAVLTRDQAGVEAIQRLQDRENAKLDALKAAPDQTMNAQLRIAACYFLLQRYDEARVLLKFLQDFAENDDQKKQISYYLVLSYASQGITDKAQDAYNDFQSKYKGDPLGENLPLAMGQAYLNPKVNQPDKAIAFFQQEMTLYPKSSELVNEALGLQAAALIGLQRYPEALETYNKFLRTSPPKDQAAQAEIGIANIYQATNKIPDAIKQYDQIAANANYAGMPQAEQCGFYGAGLEISVDPKAALPKLQAFVQKYPDGKFAAQAMMMVGQVQAATGNAPAAMQTYKDMVAKFPKTDFGPQAYFQQAAMLARAGKTDDMVTTLREFMKAYPDYKDIFFAYDTIGQTERAKERCRRRSRLTRRWRKTTRTIRWPRRHSIAPQSYGGSRRTSQGNYIALNEAQRKEWSKDVANSVAAGEKLLQQFPDSDQVGVTMKTLLSDQEMLLDAKQVKPEDIEKYFRGLAEKFGSMRRRRVASSLRWQLTITRRIRSGD